MDCSNHDIDPELRDPLLDTYHCEGAPLPEDIKAHRSRTKHTFAIDIPE